MSVKNDSGKKPNAKAFAADVQKRAGEIAHDAAEVAHKAANAAGKGAKVAIDATTVAAKNAAEAGVKAALAGADLAKKGAVVVWDGAKKVKTQIDQKHENPLTRSFQNTHRLQPRIWNEFGGQTLRQLPPKSSSYWNENTLQLK